MEVPPNAIPTPIIPMVASHPPAPTIRRSQLPRSSRGSAPAHPRSPRGRPRRSKTAPPWRGPSAPSPRGGPGGLSEKPRSGGVQHEKWIKMGVLGKSVGLGGCTRISTKV